MKTMQQAQQMLKAYKQVFTYAYLLPGEKLEQGLAHAGPGQAPTKECLRRIAPQLPNILHSDTQTRPGCPVGAKATEKAPGKQQKIKGKGKSCKIRNTRSI